MHILWDYAWNSLFLASSGIVLCLVVALLRRRAPAWAYVLAAMAVLVIDVAMVSRGFGLIPKGLIIGHTPVSWNWEGKIYAVVTTLALCFAWPGLSLREIGLTFKQNPGSFVPVLLVALLMFAIQWIPNYLSGDAKPPTAETLFYEATMPGFEEEPLWRGLLFVLLSRAFQDVRWRLLGAEIGWGAIIGSILFGLGHGVGFENGALQYSLEVAAITGFIGFLLAWVRARTGSLLLPVVLHNLSNMGNNLLGFLA